MAQISNNIMAFVYKFSHPSILRRKRRGIKPQEIKAIEIAI